MSACDIVNRGRGENLVHGESALEIGLQKRCCLAGKPKVLKADDWQSFMDENFDIALAAVVGL